MRRHADVHHVLALVAEGRVSEIVRQRQALGQILVEPQRARQRTGDLRHLDRVRQPGPEVVALVIDEDLRLVLQPPERRRMDDPVAVALERRARRAFRFGHQTADALVGIGGVGRARLGSIAKRCGHEGSPGHCAGASQAVPPASGAGSRCSAIHARVLTHARAVHTYSVTPCTGRHMQQLRNFARKPAGRALPRRICRRCGPECRALSPRPSATASAASAPKGKTRRHERE